IAIALLVSWGKGKVEEFQAEFARDLESSPIEMLVEMNPEFEMVSENSTTGEITVRVAATGEELTFSTEELMQGRVTISGEDGEMTTLGRADLSKVPSWVPQSASAKNKQSLFHREDSTGIQGLMFFETADSMDAVEAFFEGEFSGAGSSSSSSIVIGQVEQRSLEYAQGPRSIQVMIVKANQEDDTQVTVTYTESAP
ncbi:MAG: hypothetical protein ACQKBU_09165, partial [Verrucomicrobiales bacterium]